MKKLTTLLSTCLLLGSISANAQVFWTENFESGSPSGMEVTGYTGGPNGAWTMSVSIATTEGDAPNFWFVSCAEAGHIAGGCGSICTGGTGELGASLHIGSGTGSIAGADNGASYDAGDGGLGIENTTTDRRAQSPIINCTGKTGINLRFYYIENGQTTIDDGYVEYSADGGSTWVLLTNTAKTSLCGGGQGSWTVQNITLPAACDNNPNVKIGFHWINDNDGAGTDPSFAIDSVSLSVSSATGAPVASFTTTATTACQDSCITFTSTSTGSPTGYSWATSPAGATIGTSTASSTSICFPAAGTYTVTLTATNGSGSNDATTVINVNPTPHPVITQAGSDLSVPAVYTGYQWYNGLSPVAGATSNSYTISATGIYGILVDSAGCTGFDTITVSTLHVGSVNNTPAHFWVAQPDNNSININSSTPVADELAIVIYDATGRKIADDKWNAGSLAKQVSGLSLTPGLYIIKLSNNYTSSVIKWIKP